jgi:hypothetical protein
LPYAHSDEKATIRRAPVSRAASSTFSVPSTLAANVVTGTSSESSGCDIAAVWMMRSTPWRSIVCTRRGMSNSSPCTYSTPGSSSGQKSRL